MEIVRYYNRADGTQGVGTKIGGAITCLPGCASMSDIMALRVAELRALLNAAPASGTIRLDDVELLPRSMDVPKSGRPG